MVVLYWSNEWILFYFPLSNCKSKSSNISVIVSTPVFQIVEPDWMEEPFHCQTRADQKERCPDGRDQRLEGLLGRKVFDGVRVYAQASQVEPKWTPQHGLNFGKLKALRVRVYWKLSVIIDHTAVSLSLIWLLNLHARYLMNRWKLKKFVLQIILLDLCDTLMKDILVTTALSSFFTELLISINKITFKLSQFIYLCLFVSL